MATNRYFNQYHNRPEQNLIDDLIIESIEIHGTDTIYLPRTLQKEDLIYGEDPISKFDDYYDLTVYVKNFEGFTGEGDIFKKFGYEIKDQATLTISRTHFARAVGDELKRPREGDLIWFPLNEALFQIKIVKNETIYYDLGQFYVYDLEVEAFSFAEEDVETGIKELDEKPESVSEAFDLPLGSGTGIYAEKEIVYQGGSFASASAKAKVISYDTVGNVLRVRDLVGEFQAGVNVVGDTSGANYTLVVFDDMDIQQDGSAQNKPIQVESDVIIDFTEDDPFSGNDY